ncbi:MAG: HAMP domain-containing histidine kinase [Eubacterium sp.]|nr:HAMP domain-containing histidine kinase [Eubacterium sp.]MCM1216284.1 HAMP domain-containing histidine kinase [Lachnospiraceae bacterium]MCM1303795.1 HAMP domain-containing histidine kinase [Butyrivibrio sp.]MCM1342837.1 HAMP domain-containing histidine kinase [Muribaculaceae bacterium]MCM1240051.1 HAMP domain-containing histidine kinase [Lachnospiraceae bacterium]
MIRKLRKKFISITAAALFIMILSVMAAVNGIFIYQTDRMLDSRLKQMMTYQEKSFSETEGHPSGPKPPLDAPNPLFPFDHGSRPGEDSILPRFANRLDIRFDGCLVCVDESGEIMEIRQDGAGHYSEADLEEIAFQILSDKRAQGWHRYYKFHKAKITLPDGTPVTLIGLINASSSLYSVFTMLLISVVIGVLSFLLVLLMIILASGHAVRPVAESYARQKQFVTDAGHELKTPLTVISANNELLRMLYGESEWADGIDKQVAKMSGLVQDLITLARMDEEQQPVFSSFNLSDAVYDTARSFENLIHSRGRLVTFDIEEGIRCLGDESKIRQVVSILMDNAVKYCDEKGKIAVRLKSDRQIRLQVINDFHNAAHCDFEKVFERFYRADRARTSDGSYGLGLSIARSIVELHKGDIHAKALEHDRIMFEVILPR